LIAIRSNCLRKYVPDTVKVKSEYWINHILCFISQTTCSDSSV